MKVRETYVSCTGLVDVGSLALFINVSNSGMEEPMKELVDKASHFNTVVLLGRPFKQRDEIPKFVKGVTNKNPNVRFVIYTVGTVSPVGMSTMKNVHFVVNLQLKNTNMEYKHRIINSTVEWHVKMRSSIVFDIYTNDDIDEADLLIQEFGIGKSCVYLSPVSHHHIEKLLKKCKRLGYNFAPNFRKFLWADDGDPQHE